MNKIKSYQIIEEESISKLMHVVGDLIDMGHWQPLGAAFCVEGYYYQTMVKYES